MCLRLDFEALSTDFISLPLGTKFEIHCPPSAHACPHTALNKTDKLRTREVREISTITEKLSDRPGTRPSPELFSSCYHAPL